MADCLRVIEEIEAESARGADGWRDMQESLIQELFIIACRAAAVPANNESGIRARIQAVIRHMERNYADPVTTAHLEKIANMSERTLQRHFRTATGVSPLHYLLRVRIAHASRMIGETDLPMTDIGGRCGIPNSAYFSRLFQQFTGISPSAWRKRSRQGQRQG
jgi:transcriptional regulator GlxA family with amidase domain